MNPELLLRLLRNIRDLKYPIKLLRNVNDFEQQLALDLGVDRDEAMALLGYLLSHEYVRIMDDGLVVNPASTEIRKLVDSGDLEREVAS